VFETWRGKTMPTGVDASAWNHVYRLGVNTRLEANEPAQLVLGVAVKERALLG
jgi:hypothetical protein